MRAMDLTETTRPQDRLTANEVLLRSGYEMLGSGCFATVYEKPNASYVLKLFDADDLAYEAYIAFVKQNPNPHFPKFFGKSVKVSPGFYAIRMEKLSAYKGDPHLFHIYTINRDRKLDPNSYTASQMGDVEEIFYGDPSLKTALDLMIDQLTPKFRFDLWQWNLMMRGNVIVFSDPIANQATGVDRPPIPMPPPKQAASKLATRKLNDILDDDELMRELLGDD